MKNKIPNHIAIIMDGNGRWAKSKGLPRTAGHKQGAEATRKLIAECRKLGVKYLTIYAFSFENWQRPQSEIGFLMELLKLQLKTQLKELHRNGIMLKVIGDKSKLDNDILHELTNAEERTRNNSEMFLQIAFSYGGRQEILNAVKKSGGNSDLFEASLYTSGVPDPDLLIRTGGEKRLSNFMLWQIAYTELYFTDKLWPEFDEGDLREAMKDYANRERRFGNAKE